MDVQECKTTIKLLVLGDNAVGKSSLVNRFAQYKYNECPGHLHQKAIIVHGNEYILRLSERSGEQFYSLPPEFYRNALVAFLVYDIGRPETLASLDEWMRCLRMHSDEPDMAVVVVGNKLDAERAVSREDGFCVARKHGALFIETCPAQRFDNACEVFWDLVQQCVNLKTRMIRKVEKAPEQQRPLKYHFKGCLDVPIVGKFTFQYSKEA